MASSFRYILPKPADQEEKTEKISPGFYDTVSLLRTAIENKTESTDPGNLKLNRKELGQLKVKLIEELEKR